ncbi:MAG: NAD-dependent epimerase/dehydratase family protein, partial [Pseudomonadota bacterium]
LFEAAAQSDMSAVVLRLPLVYGRDNKGNLPRMIAAIDRGRFPPLPDTANKRSMVHVDDVVQALMLAAERPEAVGRVYLLTDGQTYSTRQMYELICTALGREAPSWSVPLWLLRTGARTGDLLKTLGMRRFPVDSGMLEKLLGSAWYSSDRIVDELGYHPTWTLDTALPQMVAEYRAGKN